MYGNVRSSSEIDATMSRARGPQMARHPSAPVRSLIETEPSAGAWVAIHARSRPPNAVPVTTRKRSMPSRVMVRSLSMPPRELSSWVYVIVPTPRSTSLAARRPSRSSAPGADDLELGERRFVEEPGGAPGRQVLRDDGRRPVLAGPAARPQPLVGRVLVAAVPVDPLPARLLAEDGAEPLVTRDRPVGGAAADRRRARGWGRRCRSTSSTPRGCGPGSSRGSGGAARSDGCPSARGHRAVRHRRSTRRSPSRCRRLRRCRGRRSRPPRRTRPPRSRRG